MNETIKSFDDIDAHARQDVGGKAWALAYLSRHGFYVPEGVCVTVGAYRRYMAFNGLEGRIAIELGRKDLADMRWEEMWDTSLRIRNYIFRGKFPGHLYEELLHVLKKLLDRDPVAVRSSAIAEDSKSASYAGIHESYVDVKSPIDAFDKIRLVWASLWSDAALLYKKEFGAGASAPGMAVIIQKFVKGEKSGVVFSENPVKPGQMVVEAVRGLNKNLVDGVTEPYRWILDKKSGRVISRAAPGNRTLAAGVERRPLLTSAEVGKVIAAAKRAESLFRCPQDVEWTFARGSLSILQSRPITTGKPPALSKRSIFDLSLRRSFNDLQDLKNEIDHKLVPSMKYLIKRFESVRLSSLTDRTLAKEVCFRAGKAVFWRKTYRDRFIPYGHGMRL
ncbi:MAG TPA: PEP/pyruvate-binding domain-containing protein, partial [Candidatus Omnitrophota bacterium]|nr:PEP/pyruvate-binding domain-containing protein [Candidatus Omnitrophota bacterium]